VILRLLRLPAEARGADCERRLVLRACQAEARGALRERGLGLCG